MLMSILTSDAISLGLVASVCCAVRAVVIHFCAIWMGIWGCRWLWPPWQSDGSTAPHASAGVIFQTSCCTHRVFFKESPSFFCFSLKNAPAKMDQNRDFPYRPQNFFRRLRRRKKCMVYHENGQKYMFFVTMITFQLTCLVLRWFFGPNMFVY